MSCSGPSYTSTEVAVQEKFYSLPEPSAQEVRQTFFWFHSFIHRSARVLHQLPEFVHSSVHRFPPDLWKTRHSSTGARGAGGSGSQNAADMSTAPEGRSGVPSSR